MKKLSVACFFTYLFTFSSLLFAVDIENGWSTSAKIEDISNDVEYTFFKLSGNLNGCGHDELWSLSADGSATNDAILTLLLLANGDGKDVTLKCENSVISDFDIAN